MHTNVDNANPINCLVSNLRKASRVVLSTYESEFEDVAINGTQFTMLSSILGMGEVTVSNLAAFLAMDQTTVTRNINILKRDGFVEAAVGSDKRVRYLRLTDLGVQTVEDTYPKWLKAQQAVWDALGEEDAQKLLQLTRKVVGVGQ